MENNYNPEETGELPAIMPGEISGLGAGAMADVGYRGLKATLHPESDVESDPVPPPNPPSELPIMGEVLQRTGGLVRNTDGTGRVPGD